MKPSLIALVACCAVSTAAFALPSGTQNAAVQDNPRVSRSQFVIKDDPGIDPPQFMVNDDPGIDPPQRQ